MVGTDPLRAGPMLHDQRAWRVFADRTANQAGRSTGHGFQHMAFGLTVMNVILSCSPAEARTLNSSLPPSQCAINY